MSRLESKRTLCDMRRRSVHNADGDVSGVGPAARPVEIIGFELHCGIAGESIGRNESEIRDGRNGLRECADDSDGVGSVSGHRRAGCVGYIHYAANTIELDFERARPSGSVNESRFPVAEENLQWSVDAGGLRTGQDIHWRLIWRDRDVDVVGVGGRPMFRPS